MQNIQINIRCKFTPDSEFAMHSQAGYDILALVSCVGHAAIEADLQAVNNGTFEGEYCDALRLIERAVRKSIMADWINQSADGPEIEFALA